jgi:osmotically-inducible protein OsmY
MMGRQNYLYAFAFTLVFASVTPGCAAYRKCGFRGCPGDADISAQVRTLLDRYPALQPPNLIQVHTVDHVVYLSGLVDTDFERQMAESVAHAAKGATKIENSIGLSGSR